MEITYVAAELIVISIIVHQVVIRATTAALMRTEHHQLIGVKDKRIIVDRLRPMSSPVVWSRIMLKDAVL